MHVITNNVPRYVVDAYELSAAERTEFDYLDWPAIEDGRDSASSFRYRGQLYGLGEFSASTGMVRDAGLPDAFRGWHGYMSESFFSGMLVRYTDDCESVVVARYYS